MPASGETDLLLNEFKRGLPDQRSVAEYPYIASGRCGRKNVADHRLVISLRAIDQAGLDWARIVDQTSHPGNQFGRQPHFLVFRGHPSPAVALRGSNVSELAR